MGFKMDLHVCADDYKRARNPAEGVWDVDRRVRRTECHVALGRLNQCVPVRDDWKDWIGGILIQRCAVRVRRRYNGRRLRDAFNDVSQRARAWDP